MPLPMVPLPCAITVPPSRSWIVSVGLPKHPKVPNNVGTKILPAVRELAGIVSDPWVVLMPERSEVNNVVLATAVPELNACQTMPPALATSPELTNDSTFWPELFHTSPVPGLVGSETAARVSLFAIVPRVVIDVEPGHEPRSETWLLAIDPVIPAALPAMLPETIEPPIEVNQGGLE